MIKSILDYQRSSERLIDALKGNKKVLAIFAFGSIINGDLWEGSDIDLFAVYEDTFDEIRDIYSEVLDIPVHIKVLSKEKFLYLYESDARKGAIRNLLVSSKMVFSRDEQIQATFDSAKYGGNNYSEIWNLVYLGQLIKDLGITKKYLQNDSIFTSYEVLIRGLDSFAKLYLNLNGYTVSKDSVKMAMHLNNDFNNIVSKLFVEKDLRGNIQIILEYIENYLCDNIDKAAKFLLDYLYEKKNFLSSYEIKKDPILKEFNVKVEDILKELYKRNMVLKDIRRIEIASDEKLISENVYTYKIYK